MSLAADVLAQCRVNGVTVATVESCTGGMVAAALTDVAGSSDVFVCGFVTYSNEAKIDMLGVSTKSLDDYGAVSEQIAQEMAEGALKHSTATLAVSITGIAGPGSDGPKPEGRVCFGLAMTGQKTHIETVEFGALGRSQVRAAARDHALVLLQRACS